MAEREEAKTIARDVYNTNSFEIDNKSIKINKAYMVVNDLNIENNNEQDVKIWIDFSNKMAEMQIKTMLKDFKTRTELINTIINKAVQNNISGIIINFNNIQDNTYFKRFLIELSPQLRELGINTIVVVNEGIEKEDYKKIVDYIIE